MMAQRGQVPGNVPGLAIAHAREQLQFGKSIPAIESQLASKYTSLDALDIRSAVLAAINARAAGAAIQSALGGQGVIAVNFAINPGIPSQYQYVVNVNYAVGGSAERRSRTIVVNSNNALTGAELQAGANAAARTADAAG